MSTIISSAPKMDFYPDAFKRAGKEAQKEITETAKQAIANTNGKLENHFINASIICNFIPGISWISNLVELFLRCVCKWNPQPSDDSDYEGNNYIDHIEEKPVKYNVSFVLLPVISNILFCVDYFREGSEIFYRATDD